MVLREDARDENVDRRLPLRRRLATRKRNQDGDEPYPHSFSVN